MITSQLGMVTFCVTCADMFCMHPFPPLHTLTPLGAKEEAPSQHQAEAHLDRGEQQRCDEGGPQDQGGAGHVGLSGPQELGILQENLCTGKGQLCGCGRVGVLVRGLWG